MKKPLILAAFLLLTAGALCLFTEPAGDATTKEAEPTMVATVDSTEATNGVPLEGTAEISFPDRTTNQNNR